MQNFMIDIETTGLDAGLNYITSCAIVPFDLDFEGIYEKVFHERFKCMLGFRKWDSRTKEFRDAHHVSEFERELPMRDSVLESLQAVQRFLNSLVEHGMDICVWAKPTTFDIAFLQSYYNAADLSPPWHYRNVRDLGTYLIAAGHKLEDLYKEIEMNGDAHNALHDCHYQILLAQFGFRALQMPAKMPEGTKFRNIDNDRAKEI